MTILIASFVPVMVVVAALAIEVTNWAVVKLELQRASDVAALAGIIKYANADSPQAGTMAAANLIQLSSGQNLGTTSWNAATNTLSSSVFSAQLGTGVKDAANKAITVTLSRPITKGVSAFIGGGSTLTISATSMAELDGAQPCLVSLKNQAMQFNNTAAINAPNCAIWSNGTIVASNNTAISVRDVYSAGTIVTNNSAIISGNRYPNTAAIEDPYATEPRIVSLRAGLSPGAGTALNVDSGSTTRSPGSYSSWDLTNSAQVTLNPGTYYVNGDIRLRNSASLQGTGVTIVTSGQVRFEQSSSVTLTAQSGSAGPAAGGILLVSTGTLLDLGNSGTRSMTGIVYGPNISLTMGNNTGITSTDCLEYIVGDVLINNSAHMSATNCVAMGALSFGRKRLLVQ